MSRYLVDTHVLLWFLADHPNLTERVQSKMVDPEAQLLVSVGSLWEIAIKYSLGKLELPEPPSHFLPAQLRLNRMDILPIAPEHVFRVGALPFHHRDPFDRLLVAQCLVEELPILSADAALDPYGVTRVG